MTMSAAGFTEPRLVIGGSMFLEDEGLIMELSQVNAYKKYFILQNSLHFSAEEVIILLKQWYMIE